MNEKQKAALEEELRRITEIFLRANESFYIAEYLCAEEENPERNYLKHASTFFFFTRAMYWRTTVIELSKLLHFNRSKPDKVDKRERFNLRRFIAKLRTSGEYSQAGIPSIKLENWLKRLDDNEQMIINILIQRDKVYAHEDQENKDIQNEVSFNSAKALLGIVSEIIEEINFTVFGRGVSSRLLNSPKDNLVYLVNRLHELQQGEVEDIRQHARDMGIDPDELEA